MSPAPQLRDLALRILDGPSLWADKMIDLSTFADDAPGPPSRAPASPARSPDLALHEGIVRPEASFSRLRHAGARGRLLHAMANHELQALELMALALVRFPDADPRFRRALAHVMSDEQKHLAMYVRRMEQLGVRMSDLPLSDFFWRALREPDDPLTFVVQMALVLEQANLDFAKHWSVRMHAAGDTETAAILDRVYNDEIGHVRHGLAWARRWKDDTDTLWDTFVAHATEPMTPARAVGPIFDVDSRKRAGLPDDFVVRLRTWGGSKGRPSDVWWFNPQAEDATAHHRRTGRSYAPRKTVARLARDLAALPAALARPGDIVLVPTAPRPDWLAHRLGAGAPMVQFVDNTHHLVGRTLGPARPWGWSPDAVRRSHALLLEVPLSEPMPVIGKTWAVPPLATLLSADWREDGWSDAKVVPQVCTTLEEVESRTSDLQSDGWTGVLIRGDLSASGRERWVIRTERGIQDDDSQRVRGLLERHSQVTVGPLLNRRVDLSFHGDVDADGSVRLRGVVRFETHDDGRFQGAVVGPPHRGLPRDVVRWMLGDGHDTDRLQRAARKVFAVLGPALAAEGYRGPVGVDALVHTTPEGLRLCPLIEVNARWTMGRVALDTSRRLGLTTGTLRIVSARHPSLSKAFVEETRLPTARVTNGRLVSGPLWLTDPRGAQAAVVLVAT